MGIKGNLSIGEKILRAKIKARKDLETTYLDKATIQVFTKEIRNGLTRQGEMQTIYKDIPCRLCLRLHVLPLIEHIYAESDQKFVLMISPDIEIPINSKITVNRHNGEVLHYINTYTHRMDLHQIIVFKQEETKA